MGRNLLENIQPKMCGPKYIQQVHSVVFLYSQLGRICSYMCEIHLTHQSALLTSI